MTVKRFATIVSFIGMTYLSCLEKSTNAPLTTGIFSKRVSHTAIVHDNKMWVIGGYSMGREAGSLNDVWSSTNGKIWTLATDSAAFPRRSQHTSLVFSGKMWVIGGFCESGICNDVWSSSDGWRWTQAKPSASFPVRSMHASAVHDSLMWVIGGYNYDGPPYNYDDVWSSTDGSTWQVKKDSIGFYARYKHTCLSYDGKIWIIGGRGVMDGTNEVWYSDDGTVWTQATDSVAYGPRGGHASVVYEDKMWVIGGLPEGLSETLNDVWCSSDGITWTQTTASAEFPTRAHFATVVFDGKMWVIGGTTIYNGGMSSRYLNDVWLSSDGVTWQEATLP